MFGLDCTCRDGFLKRGPAWCSRRCSAPAPCRDRCSSTPTPPRSKTRMASIDALNRRYGRGTVAYGTATGANGCTLRAEHLSVCHTRRWGDQLAV